MTRAVQRIQSPIYARRPISKVGQIELAQSFQPLSEGFSEPPTRSKESVLVPTCLDRSYVGPKVVRVAPASLRQRSGLSTQRQTCQRRTPQHLRIRWSVGVVVLCRGGGYWHLGLSLSLTLCLEYSPSVRFLSFCFVLFRFKYEHLQFAIIFYHGRK